ncbi:hypothetical protein [Flavobacterium pectinovorum]|uniref:DKNYY family protein n=1 Tax=Flavobacterium pectinovorum TaxID=29533 RepID=A0AB36P035_9FLAO|nr:hypothetical protein [Flavobacterium pectinovorum]OXB04286.1 hypothetical protein B0A72_12345 [Flavobacterium pectinovorum]SHL52688.1 hypothetical protein SAMN05444387_0815 [Flavobacterium pectinovorum]
MNKTLLVCLLLVSYNSHSQIGEGQKFCEESKIGNYFPVTSYNFNKKIFWYKTFYYEVKKGTKIINGKTYTEFEQEWEDKRISLLYFREENGVIYQYNQDTKEESIRYSINFKEGDKWETADGKDHYKIISFTGELRTPYCIYKNLLVIEAKVSYGNFKFYYFRGHGYIGATKDDKLVSCVTPER